VLGSAAVLVLLLVIDMPVWDQTPKKAWGALDSVHTYPQANAGMTPELYAGYRWIRDHTATDDVFAVSTLYADKGRTDPRYCDPPAFAERRAMISCPSDGSSQFYGRLKGDQERLILNQAIFAQGSQEALDLAAKKYGVRWLVADLRHGKINPGVFSFGPVVFRNREVAVIQALGG
jgi:hypothetical protein